MNAETYAIGVDLGGTKIKVALVDVHGRVVEERRLYTDVEGGPVAVREQIVRAVQGLWEKNRFSPVGLGIGVAGQIKADTGEVHFAPNLDWHDVPLRAELDKALGLPVVVANDVRAATYGEWLYGAGRGCSDLICVFVGTGVGGGIVSHGQMLSGCSNSAGEVGHMTVAVDGPLCTCGNRGCVEAIAGGWAIARNAQELVSRFPDQGAALLKLAAESREEITAKIVGEAFRAGDPLAKALMKEVFEALSAGMAGLVNIINPCRLILGGGVVQGVPQLVGHVKEGIFKRALKAATQALDVVPGELGGNAGVIGAAALSMSSRT